MTDIQLYAFVILPIMVALLGWAAAGAHIWASNRAEKRGELR